MQTAGCQMNDVVPDRVGVNFRYDEDGEYRGLSWGASWRIDP